jgi:hypothetical protein
MAGVKGNANEARNLESMLQAQNGVASVEANPLTGSILIHYDPAVTTGEALAAIMTGRPFDLRTSEGSFTGRLTQHLTELMIEKAVIALIAALV